MENGKTVFFMKAYGISTEFERDLIVVKFIFDSFNLHAEIEESLIGRKLLRIEENKLTTNECLKLLEPFQKLVNRK